MALVIFLSIPFFVSADSLGEKTNFFIASPYDAQSRDNIGATLQAKNSKLYFYIDDNWWDKFGTAQEQEIKAALSSLSSAFEEEIYPVLTSTFGSEWNPGIDKDSRITVLIHPMPEEVGGYVRTEDEYPEIQAPCSNTREMLYLNVDYITESLAKSLLAHEFMHLITFNQKERRYEIEEEIWLNEARSEYAPTLMGYDNVFQESNLENRVQIFLANPNDSITEWKNKKADYGALNLFIQYLVDHYGKEILSDSLHCPETGIKSINYALEKNGHNIEFSQVFWDWVLTAFINDCALGENYCYLNENLKDFHIVPSLNFLPFTGKSSLTIEDSVKDWSGRWYKIMGGKGDLKLEFDGADESEFKTSYFVCDLFGNCFLKSLILDQNQDASIIFSDFNNKYAFLTIVISSQNKIAKFSESEPAHSFILKATTIQEDETIKNLLLQIAALKQEIARLQAQIQIILEKKVSCKKFENNLYYGLNNDEVRNLQEFFKKQGSDIYPEAIVSGWFGPLTQSAVIRFQEKYSNEILEPLGMSRGTGFVGSSTRAKINQLLAK
ncbi:peptidoglycan-binding protein [Candidatus Parcubacteria bacterium]|nr:peptidoglycan-binding protein [Candidatus Parcubacteria bacterium]